MKCRPWRWLWGLLPLALIVFLTTIGERQRIERDLTVRTEQTLQAEGLGWAQLRFEGRDGVLEGDAPSQAERVLAYDIARQVHGVRILRNEARVSKIASPYNWEAQRIEGRIVLRGHMPDEASRAAALRMAKDRFPDTQIVDDMTVARGAPAEGLWATGTAFAIRQLTHIKSGVVTLTDTTIAFAGQASSPSAYKELLGALTSRLPKGWTLGKNTIEAPIVETYTWSFDRLGNDVVLNGYVPDEATRSRLVAAARATYPQATVTDRMLIAGGAPDGFDTFALAAIERTGDLDEVRVSIQDRSVSVTGLAAHQFMAGEVEDRLSAAGNGFTVANKLRAKKVLPPKADPYIWSATQRDGEMVVSGHVPDEAAREELLQRVRELYPDAKVRDEMSLASGTPGGRDAWLGAAARGLSAMALFDNGATRLEGQDLQVSGDTRDASIKARGESMLNSGADGGFAVTRTFKLLEPEVDPEEEARKLAEAEEAERLKQEEEARAKAEEERLAREAEERAREEAEAAEAERKRLAELAAAEEAERLRKIAEEKAEKERLRIAALEAERAAQAERERKEAEEAERQRIAQEQAAEAERKRKAEEEAERQRLAALQAELAAQEAVRQARRKDYRLVAEYNGTPLALWQARQAARASGKDGASVDATAYDEQAADSRGRLVLTGKVASPQMRVALRRYARSQFDGGVVDRLEVIDGAEDSEWQAAATQGLGELSRLRNGAVFVEQKRVELYGDAVSDDAARAVRQSMDREAPVRFTVSALITAPKRLKEKVVVKRIEQDGTVGAGECGNLMNSVASLEPIQFASESSEIQKKAARTLDKLAKVAEKCPQARVRVAGHTDARGPEKYNQKLSEERAEAVLSYLVKKGIARSRMRARGLGETQPLVSNDTLANRAKNRRIEFTVTEQ